MITALLFACTGDKTEPTPTEHTGTTTDPEPHTGIVAHTGHTGNFRDCSDVPILEPDWGPNDDPCAILDGRLFTTPSCDKIWFEDGWVHYVVYGNFINNQPYECRSVGPIAYLRACLLSDPFRFDRRTGELTFLGFPGYRMTARDWSDHSGTYLGEYFYRDTGYVPFGPCGYDHTGVWGP